MKIGGIQLTMPFVGVLIEAFTYSGIKNGDTGREHLPFYEEAGEQFGLRPCFFRLADVEVKRGEVVAYVNVQGQYKKKRLPIPKVIHNRILLKNRRERKQFNKLKNSGVIIFNGINRFSKGKMNQYLEQNEAIRPHIPKTYKATVKSIHKMMKRYDQLILKPVKGSVGKGILKLEREGEEWRLTYPVPHGERGLRWMSETFTDTLPAHLIKISDHGSYIIQEKIPLAQYEGSPFDLRVSVQRNSVGDWQITGIVAKVARKGHFLTNVARGGTTYTLEEVLQGHPTLELEQVKTSVEQLSLAIAKYIGKRFTSMADLGLDIGITDQGMPYFIECNGRDLRFSFRNANMMEEWASTHKTPIEYAAYLLRRSS